MLNNFSIAVLLPALNEERHIGQVIEAIPKFVDHVVVVDDGSSDNTVKIARERGAITVSHKKNRGVGAAFSTGVRQVLSLKVDIMVNMDSDGQFNPADIEKIIQPIIEERADFVTASRFIDKDFIPRMPRIKLMGNQVMARIISRLTKQKFYDVSCGFRAYNRETLLKLNLFGDFTYTQETFIDLIFKNLDVLEVPIHVRGTREHGKSRVASNLFRYAYQTSQIIIRTFRDNKPFRLFGSISFISFLIGLAFAVFLGIHYFQNGVFTPHKWAGFVAAFFAVVALLLLLIGFVLDMFSRMRRVQEEILFELKKNKGNG